MAPIATYVFLDIEPTGMPQQENNKTRITEISFVAVKREHLLNCRPGEEPRVLQKLTLCVNPQRLIQPGATDTIGLDNFLLEHEPTFNPKLSFLIHTFIDLLAKPVCLIAQNGLNFDFPLLKNHFLQLNDMLTDDVMCADSLHAFYDIMEKQKQSFISKLPPNEDNTETNINGAQTLEIKYDIGMQELHEMTPKKGKFVAIARRPVKQCNHIVKPRRYSHIKRRLFFSVPHKPRDRYRLKSVYERLCNRPALGCHQAEGDCMLMLECATAISKEFVAWVDDNHCFFSEVQAMTIGVPIDK